MKVLIIYGHMDPASFNAAMLDAAVKTLKGQGHEVTVSDLYAMKFNPIMSRMDRTDDPSNCYLFNYVNNMGEAVAKGTQAEDIKAEQRKVKEADLLIFQFPLQSLSMSAIMKGWMERVLLKNFAFNAEKGQFMENGMLAGKKAMLSITAGVGVKLFKPNGANGDIRVFLAPIHGTLRFCGLSLLRPHICYGMERTTFEIRQDMLKAWRERLVNIFSDPVGISPLLSDGVELPSDFKLPTQSSTEYGPSVAQHMGRKLPLDTI